MPATAPAWRTYHGWNPRNERLAALCATNLLRYLRSLPWLDRSRAVLDFGCGYFDAGLAIADRVGRVDGIDIEEQARAIARERTRALPNAGVFASTDELPRATYDLIIASSVFQYLGGDAGIQSTLEVFRTLLRPDGRGEVLITDLIPPRYSPARDACRSLWVALWGGALPSMFRFLWKSAFKGGGLPLHKIAPERTAELAARAGFACARLPENLTPSLQRYTCLLKLRREVEPA